MKSEIEHIQRMHIKRRLFAFKGYVLIIANLGLFYRTALSDAHYQVWVDTVEPDELQSETQNSESNEMSEKD